MTDEKGFPLESLLSGVDGVQISGNSKVRVNSIVFDSRKVTPGALFVALRGGYVDGHVFLPEARERGAVAAVVEPETDEGSAYGFRCIVRVANTRRALAALSASFYGDPSRSLDVIGVTGTDGKTTTSWYLRQMLECAGIPTGLVSTIAVQIPGRPDQSTARQTTPESLEVQRTLREMLDARASAVVLETTSHALETHRVDHCQFDIGVVTNVTREHLDFHGTIENYRAAKGSLLRRVASARHLGKRGTVVLNADDPGTVAIAPFASGADTTWYSIACQPGSRLRAEDIILHADLSEFVLAVEELRFPVRLPLPGSWNVSNCLAAAGAALAVGCSPEKVAKSIEALQPVPGRMQKVDVGQPFTVLVDYAHTPESLKSVLTECRGLTRQRVLVAFGSAGERDAGKRSIQGAVAAELADFAVFTSEDPRFEDPESIIADIASGAVEIGAVEGVDFGCVEDRLSAVRDIIGRAQPGDVVVLAGKGHEQSMIYRDDHRPWNEVEAARIALQELGYGPRNHEGTHV